MSSRRLGSANASCNWCTLGVRGYTLGGPADSMVRFLLTWNERNETSSRHRGPATLLTVGAALEELRADAVPSGSWAARIRGGYATGEEPTADPRPALEVLRPDRVIRQDWASILITREPLRHFDDSQEEGGFLQGLDLVIDRRFEHGNLSRPQV